MSYLRYIKPVLHGTIAGLLLVFVFTQWNKSEVRSRHNNNNPHVVNYYRFVKSNSFTQKTFDRLGKLESVSHYRDSVLHGKHKKYWSDGQLKVSQNFVQGVLDGPTEYYHKNGQLGSRANYKNGYPADGPFIYWHENGKIARQGYYKDGKAEGEWLDYHKNGELRQKALFQRDSLIGDLYIYDESGNLVSTIPAEN